jgi:hypothetical protein
MPPKRKRAADLANESKLSEEESPPKKQKLMATKQSSSSDLANSSKSNNSDKNSQTKTDPESDNAENNAGSDSEDDDGKPICWYDENCYRQNPAHFVQFRHPKKTAQEKQKKKDASASGSQAIVGT